ncbi:hypothetical protein VB712_13090 [Spirulina sp. CCNP1310]|uniref:hypothetical protein n=1 Tax=Spirulina sp. CCNP1310 TaxID=3110249 RepID=UPI002B20E2B6|nr:hypothetical protein [Spirulina sp. CCNP1310]MEA5420159.1 hypothetical protein [Spirulina sp. CCNP1310]
MDWQEILHRIDHIVNQQTGKHLSDLQAAILKGVLKGQRYASIAQDYGCTTGHIKDTSYKLWKILSLALGEPIHKTNIRATLERQALNLTNPSPK